MLARSEIEKKPEYDKKISIYGNDIDSKAMDLNKNVNGCNDKSLKINSCKILICLQKKKVKYYAHKNKRIL